MTRSLSGWLSSAVQLHAFLFVIAAGSLLLPTTAAWGQATPAAPGAKPAESLVGEVVTTGEFVDAAKAIEEAAKNDASAFSGFFDMGAVADAALKGVTVKEEFRQGFKQGVANVPANASITGQIAAAIAGGGKYTLLRVHKKGNQHAALFRLDNGGGFNYHDLKLVKGTDGKIKVNDLYILLSGELLSTTFRQMVLPVIANQNRNLAQKLTQKESDYVTHFPKVQDLAAAVRAKDFDKAMEVYKSMPKSLQETKPVIISRMQIATQTQHWDETSAATADYRRLFPSDGAADLIGLDALIIDKKYDEALASVDRIDKIVGGDANLNTTRAQIQLLKSQK